MNASIYKAPTWDGRPTSLHRFIEQFRNYCVKIGKAYVLFSAIEGIDEPTGAGRAAKIAESRVYIYTALEEALDETLRTAIALDVPFGNPDDLWAAILAYGAGAADDTSGPQLQEDLANYAWPTSGTTQEQVRKVITDLSDFLHRSTALGADSDYTITQAVLAATFRRRMPSPFQVEEARYRAYNTLAKLLIEAEHDAKRFDANPALHGGTILVATPRAPNAPTTPATPTAICHVCAGAHWMTTCSKIAATDRQKLEDMVNTYKVEPIYKRDKAGNYYLV